MCGHAACLFRTLLSLNVSLSLSLSLSLSPPPPLSLSLSLHPCPSRYLPCVPICCPVILSSARVSPSAVTLSHPYFTVSLSLSLSLSLSPSLPFLLSATCPHLLPRNPVVLSYCLPLLCMLKLSFENILTWKDASGKQQAM